MASSMSIRHLRALGMSSATRALKAPCIIIAPVVGFDRQCFRLGYGGGYFGRTLAAGFWPRQVVGVGYSVAEVKTIHPLSHDIAMDLIVTESELLRPY